MKKTLSIFLAGTVLLALSSCKKYFDINQNPNQATYSTPELVLPQAITATANNTVAFNTYGRQTVGYLANGGGVSGWGAIISYNYTTSDFQGLWNSTYNIINDFQYVANSTNGNPAYVYYNAVSKIMKAYNFQLLVDTYGDIPYTEALQGTANLQPAYDKAEDIYKDLGVQLDSAITMINEGQARTEKPTVLTATADVMFKGDLAAWKRFANTIKLRLMVRAMGKVAFASTAFDAAGFITDDAIVNPGYTKVAGKQNPMWESFAYSAANAAVVAGSQVVPTPYILTFYNGTRLIDTGRGRVVYKAWAPVANGTTTPVNQLGYQGSDAARGAAPNSWFIGTSATAYSSIGIFKGPDAGQPLMLAAESYLLQAEANVRGIVPGDAKANFNTGIMQSFRYLYKNAANAVTAGRDPAKSATDYINRNLLSPLANFDLAVSTDQKIEAIITQKYIALNMIHSNEPWNEFRRTGYPRIVPGSSNPRETFASMTSEATSANKLPTRLLYPESEFRYNQGNVPREINPFSSKIFWAL